MARKSCGSRRKEEEREGEKQHKRTNTAIQGPTTNVKSQKFLSLGDSVVWLREYVFPLTFPIQTSKPASARR